jgi:hypothetical protein
MDDPMDIDERRRKVRELKEQGLGLKKIAEALGIAKHVAMDDLRDRTVKTKPHKPHKKGVPKHLQLMRRALHTKEKETDSDALKELRAHLKSNRREFMAQMAKLEMAIPSKPNPSEEAKEVEVDVGERNALSILEDWLKENGEPV